MATTAYAKPTTTSNNEAAQGWTHEAVITWEDFLSSKIGTIADSTAHTYTLAIPAGSVVTDFSAELVTDFTDSGSGDELNLIVGDGDDDNGYLTDFQLHASGTPVTVKQVNTGALIATASKAYAAADTIDLKFTPDQSTGTAYSVNELTAGEIKFRWRMITA
jgi:hypothetical protein